MEMLENSIKKYQNNVLTAAEFIDELTRQSREVMEMDKEPEQMGCLIISTASTASLPTTKVPAN